MASYQESVAAEIRAELARQKRSQGDIAAAAGWSQQYLSRRLVGAIAFSTTDIETIAALLGVPLSQFVSPPAKAATA